MFLPVIAASSMMQLKYDKLIILLKTMILLYTLNIIILICYLTFTKTFTPQRVNSSLIIFF